MIQSSLTTLAIFTARKRSLGQGYIFTPVCHSVHRGGGSASVYAAIPTPRDYASPSPGTVHSPQDHAPARDHAPPPGTMHLPGTMHQPPPQSMLGDTVNARAVRILLECNLSLVCTPLKTNLLNHLWVSKNLLAMTSILWNINLKSLSEGNVFKGECSKI